MTIIITPNNDQQTALEKIDNWFSEPKQTFSLGGLAGTGKSTIIPLILDSVPEDTRVRLATPTGKAAAVVNAKLGRKDATTIHSLAYRPVGNRKRTDRRDHLGRDVIEPIFEEAIASAELIIVDEASMVGDRLYDRLLDIGDKILFIGDHGQLPPVHSEDISPSLTTRDHTLTEIVRQAKDSPIRQLAYEVRQGGPLTSRFQGIDILGATSTLDIAQQCHERNIDFIVAATNKMREAMNQHLRNLLGFRGEPVFSPGERIIITSNSHPHQVFNGELYVIEEVYHRSTRCKEGEVIVCDLRDPDTDRVVSKIDLGYQWRTSIAFRDGVSAAADLGYCLTAHKAQGSQADKVAVINEPIGWMGTHAPAWRYTAVTRAAKELVIFRIGS